jgi:hypothetical protein
MKSIDDIRIDNLRLLATEQGGVGRLALVLGKGSSQVSQWLNRSLSTTAGSPGSSLLDRVDS